MEAKDRRNGYDHFLAKGISELRASSAAVDLRYYRTKHPSVRSDLDAGQARDAFVHYLTKGRDNGLAAVPPIEDQVTERQAAALNRHRADNLLPGSARMVLDFSCAGTPAVSVILILRDRFALTLLTLGSLRANFAGDIELILIDIGSTDDTRRIGHFVRGASVLRFDTSLNRISVRNAALNCASAAAVLFMDSAVELAPGALAAALRRLQSDAGIGAVGGKLVRAHGRLEAAGNIVWRDGATLGYLHDGSPLAPEANYVRDVDFCSATFLLLRADLLHQIEGFDDAFAEGGYADVDLCLRIAAAGSRVVYDPAVVVNRLTQIGAGPGPGRRAGGAAPEARQPVAVQPCRRPPCRGIRALERCRSSRAVHRRHDTIAPARLGVRAFQRPDPGDGVTRLSRHGVSDKRLPVRSCHDLWRHAGHGRGDARPDT